MLPLQRFHRAIHPPVHPFHSSPSHTPGYIASIFSRSSRAASSAALVPTLLFIFSLPVASLRTPLFVADYEFFISQRTVRTNETVLIWNSFRENLEKLEISLLNINFNLIFKSIFITEGMKNIKFSFLNERIPHVWINITKVLTLNSYIRVILYHTPRMNETVYL